MTEAGYEVHGERLLSFELIPFDEKPYTDWLFFYSQHGVHFFFQQYQKLENIIPFPYRCAAMGPATAAVIESYIDEEPYFTGTGHPQKTAAYFYEIAAGDPVTFVQAKQSKQSVQRILDGQIRVTNLIVYDNVIKSEISLPHFDILVFTSPLNVQAYFSKYDLKQGQRVIAIGGTTQTQLKKLGVKCIVSLEPSEKGLVEVCIGI